MKNLRSGTLIELFDITSTPSEAALGELCLLVKECGYGVTRVKEENDSIIIMFENSDMDINGSFVIDKLNCFFSVAIIDENGQSHGITTRKEDVAFNHMGKFLNEEVDIKKKYKKLDESAKYLLSWMMRQYTTAGIFVFSYNDLGIDLDESTKEIAINSLVDQEFLRASQKNTLILDRTLADDIRDMIK